MEALSNQTKNNGGRIPPDSQRSDKHLDIYKNIHSHKSLRILWSVQNISFLPI